MTPLRALGAILFLAVSGRGAVRLLAGARLRLSPFGMIPLWFGAGLGALAVLGDLAMLCGFGLRAAGIPLCALFACGLSRGPAAPRPPAQAPSRTELLLLCAVLFGAGSVLALSLSAPMHYWDSRAIWGAKAKMLYHADTVFTSDFMDPGRVNPHFRYPLLFPMAEAFLYRAAGAPDDGAVMLLVGLFFPLLLCFLYETASLHVSGRRAALAAPALVAVLPVFFVTYGSAYSGYADVVLAMLFCLSAGITLLWIKEGGTRLLLLSAFLSALLPLTKNEGWALAALNLALVASSRRPAACLAHLAPLLLAAAPWLLIAHKLAMDPADANDILQLRPRELAGAWGRLPMVCGYFLRALAGPQKDALGNTFLWGGFWPLFAGSSLAAVRLGFKDAGRLAGAVVLGFCLLGAAYLVIPGVSESYMTSNFFRVTQALVPLAALQIALTLDALGKKA